MSENSSYIPKLTLEPNAAEAAVQEAPALEVTDEEVEAKAAEVKKLDISSLSPAEQAAVHEFAEKIDILNTEQVMNYGAAALIVAFALALVCFLSALKEGLAKSRKRKT